MITINGAEINAVYYPAKGGRILFEVQRHDRFKLPLSKTLINLVKKEVCNSCPLFQWCDIVPNSNGNSVIWSNYRYVLTDDKANSANCISGDYIL